MSLDHLAQALAQDLFLELEDIEQWLVENGHPVTEELRAIVRKMRSVEVIDVLTFQANAIMRKSLSSAKNFIPLSDEGAIAIWYPASVAANQMAIGVHGLHVDDVFRHSPLHIPVLLVWIYDLENQFRPIAFLSGKEDAKIYTEFFDFLKQNLRIYQILEGKDHCFDITVPRNPLVTSAVAHVFPSCQIYTGALQEITRKGVGGEIDDLSKVIRDTVLATRPGIPICDEGMVAKYAETLLLFLEYHRQVRYPFSTMVLGYGWLFKRQIDLHDFEEAYLIWFEGGRGSDKANVAETFGERSAFPEVDVDLDSFPGSSAPSSISLMKLRLQRLTEKPVHVTSDDTETPIVTEDVDMGADQLDSQRSADGPNRGTIHRQISNVTPSQDFQPQFWLRQRQRFSETAAFVFSNIEAEGFDFRPDNSEAADWLGEKRWRVWNASGGGVIDLGVIEGSILSEYLVNVIDAINGLTDDDLPSTLFRVQVEQSWKCGMCREENHVPRGITVFEEAGGRGYPEIHLPPPNLKCWHCEYIPSSQEVSSRAVNISWPEYLIIVRREPRNGVREWSSVANSSRQFTYRTVLSVQYHARNSTFTRSARHLNPAAKNVVLTVLKKRTSTFEPLPEVDFRLDQLDEGGADDGGDKGGPRDFRRDEGGKGRGNEGEKEGGPGNLGREIGGDGHHSTNEQRDDPAEVDRALEVFQPEGGLTEDAFAQEVHKVLPDFAKDGTVEPWMEQAARLVIHVTSSNNAEFIEAIDSALQDFLLHSQEFSEWCFGEDNPLNVINDFKDGLLCAEAEFLISLEEMAELVVSHVFYGTSPLLAHARFVTPRYLDTLAGIRATDRDNLKRALQDELDTDVMQIVLGHFFGCLQDDEDCGFNILPDLLATDQGLGSLQAVIRNNGHISWVEKLDENFAMDPTVAIIHRQAHFIVLVVIPGAEVLVIDSMGSPIHNDLIEAWFAITSEWSNLHSRPYPPTPIRVVPNVPLQTHTPNLCGFATLFNAWSILAAGTDAIPALRAGEFDWQVPRVLTATHASIMKFAVADILLYECWIQEQLRYRVLSGWGRMKGLREPPVRPFSVMTQEAIRRGRVQGPQ